MPVNSSSTHPVYLVNVSSHGILLLSVAVSTTDLQFSRLVTFFHADERPIISGFSSSTIAHNQVQLGLPTGPFLSDGRFWIAAVNAQCWRSFSKWCCINHVNVHIILHMLFTVQFTLLQTHITYVRNCLALYPTPHLLVSSRDNKATNISIKHYQSLEQSSCRSAIHMDLFCF